MDTGIVVINIDIDTTGLVAGEDQICRIFAFDNEVEVGAQNFFSKFLMPTCAFPKDVSALNGFSIEGESLLLGGDTVHSVSQEQGFHDLYEYIRGKGKCILISHNAKRFLAQFMVFGFKKYLNLNARELDDQGIKFADSYLMMKPMRDQWLPGIENLKEPTIHQYLFPDGKTYKTPNARNDAIALREILARLEMDRGMIARNSFSAMQLYN